MNENFIESALSEFDEEFYNFETNKLGLRYLKDFIREKLIEAKELGFEKGYAKKNNEMFEKGRASELNLWIGTFKEKADIVRKQAKSELLQELREKIEKLIKSHRNISKCETCGLDMYECQCSMFNSGIRKVLNILKEYDDFN